MPTPTQVQIPQADGYVERDPAAMTIDELYGRAPADDSEIVPTGNDDDDSLPDPAAPPSECEYCGDDFPATKLRNRRSELNPGACLGCADLEKLPLSDDESNELAEDYWSRRYDA